MTLTETNTQISIIVPCFNEAESLDNLFDKLAGLREKLAQPHELVFVDDGSTDSTHDRLKELYSHRLGRDVKVIRHVENMGIGAALKTGLLNSKGQYIASIDSDCTYEPDCLIDMLKMLKDENADMITASVFHPEGSIVNVPYYRMFLSRNLSRLYSVILGVDFYTYTCMFRIYRARALRDLDFHSAGFLVMAEIMVKLHKKSRKILEYPATLTARKYGRSKARVIRMILNHLRFITQLLLRKEEYK